MYTDHGKRKERRKQILDEAFTNFTGWRYQGGIKLLDLCDCIASCRYSDTHIKPRTLYDWIKSDLKDRYMIIMHHGYHWIHRI